MHVFFAPDYRAGVAYQGLLADALRDQGIEVTFPRGHRRVLPLWRGISSFHGDLLHLHWPEKFFEVRRDRLDALRKLRYPLDLALTTRKLPIVLTAHDLKPHNRAGESLLHANFQRTYNAARAVIVHSQKAGEAVAATYGVNPERISVIPHGDLSVSLGGVPGSNPLPSRAESRAALNLPPDEPICLMFGTVEPYKGIEPVVKWWRETQPPATLAIAGKPFTPAYADTIRTLAGNTPNIRLDLAWQSDTALKHWLAAADCVLFHYNAIFTSGAACLARSLGIPILIPRRLDTIDLAEPHPMVFRFDSLDTDFSSALIAALSTKSNYQAATQWRTDTAWPRIAELTARIYHQIA